MGTNETIIERHYSGAANSHIPSNLPFEGEGT
ncbi:MAG: hypothetical protein H6Q41_983 [Deltaproteobacteria bacterium]|jgi:hypothetical protein|nr:hypothetical protein [Deltaproteobacteria bacterium]